jgi:hypothetical protein
MDLELSENDRILLIFALGLAYGKLGDDWAGRMMMDLYRRTVSLNGAAHFPAATLKPESNSVHTDAIAALPDETMCRCGKEKLYHFPSPNGRLWCSSGSSTEPFVPASISNSGREQAAAILAPLPKPTLWAKTKNGKPPESFEVHKLEITKLYRKDSNGSPRLILTAIEPGVRVDLLKISVWDEALFKPVALKQKQPWTYYLTYSSDGKYTNLAGMDQP